ncbi:hypothetical protein ACFFJT_06285 [Dyella flava]|uniref:Uncharacterized protein n=1 Tax=Dyella flava TaxID=1920170 RepID=A0ABS2K1C0_9GAMM|nr:hypothetical protein [Dyella flava]MBM7124850.1 hypothetical protein [Dyella flava]
MPDTREHHYSAMLSHLRKQKSLVAGSEREKFLFAMACMFFGDALVVPLLSQSAG